MSRNTDGEGMGQKTWGERKETNVYIASLPDGKCKPSQAKKHVSFITTRTYYRISFIKALSKYLFNK